MNLINKLYNKLTNADLSWKSRSYDFYLLFGSQDEAESPWLKPNWDLYFKPCFDEILKQVEKNKETGIRVNKYKAEKRISKKDKEEFIYHSEIKLGRLKWNDESHNKWTIENSDEEYFQNLELWSPIWTVCEKCQTPPEVFISIANERNFDNQRDLQFGYFIVIAVAENLNIEVKSIISELSQKVNAKAAVLKKRKWGTPEKAGKWIFKNGIQDTFSTGIYKEKDLHNLTFGELEFEPVWEIIYQGK